MVIYTLPVKRTLGHDCHLKAFARKPRQDASFYVQLQFDLPVVCSRRDFFFKHGKAAFFFKEGPQNIPLTQVFGLCSWEASSRRRLSW